MIDLSKYLFSVVYTVDVPEGQSLEPFTPPDDDERAILGAYVTPVPPEMHSSEPTPVLPGMPVNAGVPDFDSVETAMWDWFSDGAYSAREHVESLHQGGRK